MTVERSRITQDSILTCGLLLSSVDILFISDLHLSLQRPEKIDLFRRLLQGPARKAQALYVLGDLFEQFWVGNDDRTPPSAETLAEIGALAAGGVKVYVMRGNRELMLDRGFELLSGAVLLPDASVINLHGTPVLLMHGDLLCTRDRTYQAYRAFLELRPVRGIFLNLHRRLRAGLAYALRPMLRRSVKSKTPDIIDVDQATVERTMRAHGVVELIHGHTHRPAVHAFELDGRPARRIVLGDWYVEPLMLVCRDGRKHLLKVEEYVNGRMNLAIQ